MIDYIELKNRLKATDRTLNDLYEGIQPANKKKRLAELKSRESSDTFWDDIVSATKVSKEIRSIEKIFDEFNALFKTVNDVKDLIEISEMDNVQDIDEVSPILNKLEQDIDDLSVRTLLSSQYDPLNAILTLHAGAGGTEAQDWCEMLFRMYQRYAESKNWKVTILDYLEGDGAGIKSVTFRVEGEYSYGYLKSEKGVHRLVRISPFDSNKRRHTSFASLEVMPEIEDDNEIEIRSEDLKVDTYRSSGAGGQHVNKTESAIRITHIPTSIVVACQNERSQIQNRETAMRMLKSKLVELREREKEEENARISGVLKKIEWGSQIRSYVFCPYTLVKDHRTNYENSNVAAVMDGDLDGFINAYLKASAVKE